MRLASHEKLLSCSKCIGNAFHIPYPKTQGVWFGSRGDKIRFSPVEQQKYFINTDSENILSSLCLFAVKKLQFMAFHFHSWWPQLPCAVGHFEQVSSLGHQEAGFHVPTRIVNGIWRLGMKCAWMILPPKPYKVTSWELTNWLWSRLTENCWGLDASRVCWRPCVRHVSTSMNANIDGELRKCLPSLNELACLLII